MQQRSITKPANLDRGRFHARVAHVRANYEQTGLDVAWATAIVAVVVLALVAVT
jgi:hypothetical protein